MNSDFNLVFENNNVLSSNEKQYQANLMRTLLESSNELGAGESYLIESVPYLNNSESEVVNAVVSGLSIPAIIISAGQLLKHLSPLLVEYMKGKSLREITVESSGKKVTVKGGHNFESDLQKVIENLSDIDDEKA